MRSRFDLAGREADCRNRPQRRLRFDPCPHAADRARRPVGRSKSWRAVCVPRAQPCRPRFDAAALQLDKRHDRVGCCPRGRPADRRFAERARLHDRHGIAAERIVCVPNGVPANNNHAERHRPTGTWTLGVVALFRPRKGHRGAAGSTGRAAVTRRERAAAGGWRLRNSAVYKSDVLGLAERLGLAEAIDWIGFTRNVNRELARSTSLCCRACSAKGCRWSCSRRWPPACR